MSNKKTRNKFVLLLCAASVPLSALWSCACGQQTSMPLPAPSFRLNRPSDATPGAAESSLPESATLSTAGGASNGGSGKMLYGQVGVSELLTGDEKLQLGLRTSTPRAGANVILRVEEGSLAQQAGLQGGDQIVDVKRQGDLISLTIDRSGQAKTFNLSLQSTGNLPELGLRIPRPDSSAPMKTPFALNAEHLAAFVNKNQDQPMYMAKVSETARFLSQYDVELIVDASMSMRRPDCPGMMSRWNWCGAQSVALSQALAPFARQGITLTSFNRMFDVYEHQSPEQITSLFARTNLAFNTRLAEPLADRLNDYLTKRPAAKPRLIAVITDGVPAPREEPQMVIDVLIHAANMIKDPRELTVVFFQIGSRDPVGQQFLQEVDNNLVARGAHFDIVQTVSFDRLARVGLAQGLADAIRSFDYRTHL